MNVCGERGEEEGRGNMMYICATKSFLKSSQSDPSVQPGLRTTVLEQGLANSCCRWPGSEYSRLCRLYGLCYS